MKLDVDSVYEESTQPSFFMNYKTLLIQKVPKVRKKLFGMAEANCYVLKFTGYNKVLICFYT